MSNLKSFFKSYQHKYLYVFADCLLTKGAFRSLLSDVSRRKMYFIDNDYAELFPLFREYQLGQLVDMIDDDDVNKFEDFVRFLTSNELAEFVDDIKAFPGIEVAWEEPSQILRAIIDSRTLEHDFEMIFSQLFQLDCKFIQLRFYETRDVAYLENVLSHAISKDFRSVDLLIKDNDFQTSYSILENLIESYPIIGNIVVHSSSKDSIHKFKSDSKVSCRNKVLYTTQNIDSCSSCGIINLEGMFVPNLVDFMENKLFNSCLNKKIGIDEDGFVKNCPSMPRHFGHSSTVRLSDIIINPEFTSIWGINKKKISICQDCEFQDICIDCRSYVTDMSDLYSKPKKCNYDPYSATWYTSHLSVPENVNS